MRIFFCALGGALLGACCASAVFAGERPSGFGPPSEAASAPWRPLFDGKSLDGWEHVGAGRMVLEDGLIRTEGGMGLLWYTREKLGDCVVRVVYKTSHKNSNAGVFVRIADRPKDEWFGVHHGFEVQIDDSEGDAYHRTGAIYSLAPATARPARPSGEWNTMEITLEGQKIQVALNGRAVTHFDAEKIAESPPRTKNYEPERGPRPASGYFGLQNHDDAGGLAHPVYYKEVSVRRLKD